MSRTAGSVRDDAGLDRQSFIWVAPVAFLLGLWLWLAFSSGGYLPRQWLLPAIVLGFFGLVVGAFAAYPRRPGQLSLVVLALFGGYSVWVAVSALWAASTGRVWLESGRTFAYLLILALALVYFTAPAARTAFRYLLIAAAFVLVAVCVWRLWSTPDVALLFVSKRLTYPASYPNNSAAVFLIFFWPLMWLASGPGERAPIRGLTLGLATGLLALALMTQSRGALWSLAISLVLMFVLSPARLRLFMYLVVPALLMAYAFPRLNRYWLEDPQALGGALAARTIAVAVIMAAVIGAILALLEHWVPVRGRVKTIIGGTVLVLCAAGLIYGGLTLTRDAGGPGAWVSQTWQQFTETGAKQNTSGSGKPSGVRFAEMSSAGRVPIWKVAWREFENAPLLGAGADNFVLEYNRLQNDPDFVAKPRQAHSITLQVLGETGIIGGLLVFAGILLTTAVLLWPRFAAGWAGARRTRLGGQQAGEAPEGSRSAARRRSSRWGADPMVYGWEMALFVAVAYWFIHANVEWLWQMAGVSIPAVLMLAAGVASVDARAVGARPRANAKISGSRSFQIALIVLSVLVLVLAGLPYLGMQYENSALALSRTDALAAAERAVAATWLTPGDPAPYVTQASIYTDAARDALATGGEDRAGAVLDNLALAVGAYENAIARDPADWPNHYRAGWAVLDLVLARDYAEGRGAKLEAAGATQSLGGRHDWSAMAGSLPSATRYRDLTRSQLLALASGFMSAAKERSPLEPAVNEAIELIEKLPKE